MFGCFLYISILCFLKVRWLGLIFAKNGCCSSNLGWGPQGFQGYIYIWVNYNDLTATSLESRFIREIIPKWP